MPIDKYTHDFFKPVKTSLSSIVGRLDQLIGIANRPRDDAHDAKSEKGAPTQEDHASIGKTFLALHTPCPKKDTEKPWYKTLDGWKKVLEITAIPFAILYAFITYLQWKDIRHNFRSR